MTIYSRIAGTGSYLPQRRLSNADLVAELAAKGIESSDDWIVERTGIRARHFAAPDQMASDLALQASLQALAAAGLTADDLDLIVVAPPPRTWCSPPPLVFCKTNWAPRAQPPLTFRRFAVVSFMPPPLPTP